MDHSNAHVMELASEMKTVHVNSAFTSNDKDNRIAKSEHTMHNKEQHQQSEYYHQLGEIIQQYDAVLLFGPTDAKRELHNQLTADHRFADIKVAVVQTGKMTENQEHAFVRDHFSKALQ